MTDTAACEYHLPIIASDDGDIPSAVGLLAAASGLSNQAVKQAMQKGAVWITYKGGHSEHTQRLRRASKKLQVGDELHFYHNPEVLAEEPTPAELIADEGQYSVWSKPYGMLSQGSKWGDHCTVYRWAEQHLEPQRSAFIVHRLDRAASGLILIAHSKRMAASLSALFQKREVEKHYRVTVKGDFSNQRSPWGGPLVVAEPLDDKPAKSQFTCLSYSAEEDRSILDVNIETGRKHQIRRHLADIGFPVIGDRLYGDQTEAGEDENLQLVACQLSFECPISGELKNYQLGC